MTVTKEQALKALDRMQSLYPHAKPDATLRQFIEQSQDSGHAPAPTDELPFASKLADRCEALAEWEPCDCGCPGGKSPKSDKDVTLIRAAAALRRRVLAAPTQAPQQPAALQEAKEALELAYTFIREGVEFNYISDKTDWRKVMRETRCAVESINAALATPTEAVQGKENLQ